MVDHKALEIEADHILDAVNKEGLILRLVGSVAILRRCPNHSFLAISNRTYRDIDFAALKKEARAIHQLLTGLGDVEEREVFVVSEGARAIFESASRRVHVDVFSEKLDFSHPTLWDNSLHTDALTLPRPELRSARCRSSRSLRKILPTWLFS